MAQPFSASELDRLRVLREAFLDFEARRGETGADPYWLDESELALYDATFGARIGWKWDAVLQELVQRERLTVGRSVLDWGCGSGVAARRYLAAATGVERVFLWDHSAAARAFAAGRLRAEHPGIVVEERYPEEAPDVLLVSHVLGELDGVALEALLRLAERAGSVVWVEPGSRVTSRRLGAVRERLREAHAVLAPCTHQAACGALTANTHWCHFFARVPRAVHTEGRWAVFGRELGIDLRSLPYSFLALVRRGHGAPHGAPEEGHARILGRPRLTRGRAQLDLCDAQGVAEVDFLQRTDKRLFKALGEVAGEPWIVEASVEGRRARVLARIGPGSGDAPGD